MLLSLRLLFVLLLVSSVAVAQRRPALPTVAVEQLTLQALDKDRTVALTWEAWAPGPYPERGDMLFERSTDGQTWQRVAEQFYWLPSKGRKQLFRFQTPLDLRFRHYRLTVRDHNRRLTHHLLPPLQLTNALLYAQHQLDPATRTVHLAYAIQRRKDLLLRVYDRIGQQVDTRAIPTGPPGSYTFDFDCRHLANGTYLLVITQVEDDMNIASLRLEL